MISYISIKQVLDDLLDHPLLQDLTFERAINYAVHFIQIVGVPQEFEEKIALVEIENYRGCLPCDFYKMIQVRTYKEDGNVSTVFRYATDSFHYSSSKESPMGSGLSEPTYKLLNNVIFTSIKEGTIEIAYHSIKVDDEGYPMVPDNSSFILALELYIKKKVFTILFDLGKLNQGVLQNTLQEYAWYVGQAQKDLSMPSIDQMESIKNSWCTLLLNTNSHSNGFKTLGSKEYIKRH